MFASGSADHLGIVLPLWMPEIKWIFRSGMRWNIHSIKNERLVVSGRIAEHDQAAVDSDDHYVSP